MTTTLVRGHRHLAHQVARDEDGAALGREAAEKLADPADAVGVEAVHRLVEEQNSRIAEQRAGDAETLTHPEGEATDPLVGNGSEPDEVEDLIDACTGDVVRPCEHPKMSVRAASRMDRLRFEQRTDLAKRPAERVKGAAADRDRAAVGCVEPHDQPHRRRFPGAVRTEKTGHVARLDREGEIVDGNLLAVVLDEAARDDVAPTS